jgi:hypothetical protein
MIVDLKAGTALAAFVKRAAPSYRKRKVSLNVTSAVSLDNGYWDGGSRSKWSQHDAQGNRLVPLRYPTAPAPFSNAAVPTVSLVNGLLIVEDGTFCGKPATLRINGTAEDIARLQA